MAKDYPELQGEMHPAAQSAPAPISPPATAAN